MLKRTLTITALLTASVLLAACDHKADKVSTYDPALDGPTPPTTPVVAGAFLDGKLGGGTAAVETPAPKPKPATVPAETPPGGDTTPASAGVDAAKGEIDTRLEQIKQLVADGKFEEYEKAGGTPEEIKAKSADELQKAIDKDKADPAAALKEFGDMVSSIKAAKPALSADGMTATYTLGTAPVVFKKVDGVWYYSQGGATPPPAPAP